MDKARLDAIRARCEAATPGPWKLSIDGDSIVNESGQTVVGAFWHDGPLLELPDRNAEFIAHARTDVPDLLAEIERLTAEADTWRRRAECMESDLVKTLRAIPVGMCKQFCKRYRANCGVWGECNPEWRGPEEDKQ